MTADKHGERGSFAADIADDAIAAALRAVESHRRESQAAPTPAEGGTEVPVAVAEEEPVTLAVAGEESELAAARDLLERIAALEHEKAQKEPLLEGSLRRCRETVEQLKEANERVLRLAADLENYRKRAQREKEEIQRFAIEGLLKALLPVIDNLDRALDAAPSCTDVPSFAAGVEMTRKLFEDTLGRFGVKGFRALGETFDPHVHEAVQGIESHEHPVNTIVQEIVRGFFLHDRLVRPAMVVVSRGPGQEQETNGAPTARGDGVDAA